MEIEFKGRIVIIDDEDFELWNSHKWRFDHPSLEKAYLRTKSKDKPGWLILHRAILNVTDSKLQIDHINGNTLDNRKCNLRVCPRGMYNAINRPKQENNTSGFKGVFERKDRSYKDTTYRVCIRYKQKLIHFGHSTDLEYAAAVYNEAAKLLFGEFAYLNPVNVQLDEDKIKFIHEKVKSLNHEYTFKPKSIT